MANSQLLGKQYKIPPDIINTINAALVSHPQGNGVRRAKFVVRNATLTYEAMKRIKHDLEHTQPNSPEYALAGGELMLTFINRMLNTERAGTNMKQTITQDVTNNVMAGTENAGLRPGLNEVKKKDLVENAIAIIVNGDNKILLAKRAIGDFWGSGKWALIGGGVEKKDKNVEEACRREVKEETGLVLGDFIKSYTLQRQKDSIEHMFVTRYDGDGMNIRLNDENTAYGWFSIEEIKFLDTVPLLMEYLSLAFKSYD